MTERYTQWRRDLEAITAPILSLPELFGTPHRPSATVIQFPVKRMGTKGDAA